MVADPLLQVVLDGRYRIVEAIGEGGSGRVYRAEQVRAAGRAVAVKVLHADGGSSPALARRFENEARIIAGLRHPNTIQLFDTGRLADGRLYLVTEFLQGETLSDRLHNAGPLSRRDTLVVMEQIAGALVEAHELGVVHRDLKPANVFLQKVGSQEVLKVLDFGIAKMVDAARITAPNQIFGTPAFMSPEQSSAGPVDARSDLYSLGAIAYYALTDHHPVEGETIVEVLQATIEQPPKPLPSYEHLQDLPPEYEALVMQLLAKHPGDRLPDAESVKSIVQRLLKHHDETNPVPVATPEGAFEMSIPEGATDPLTRPPTAVDPTAPVPVPEVSNPELATPEVSNPELDASAEELEVAAADEEPAATLILTEADFKLTELAGRRDSAVAEGGSELQRNLLLAVGSAAITAAIAAVILWYF